ncbi:MAG: tetratricopeptide repeat protein [Kiritimatiellae bacterium]|nr:tetratricopeptide repeat protein [Kiritimatiellia bacterium]
MKKRPVSMWRYVQVIFLALTAITFLIYAFGYLRYGYPGTSLRDATVAAGLIPIPDLTHPLYRLVTRLIAWIPFFDIHLKLNLFCALCSACSVGLFFLMLVRLIVFLAAETPGGAMRVQFASDDEDEETLLEPVIPKLTLLHNQYVIHAAILGATGASIFLAFCIPFWLTATRLYPFAFDTLFLFLALQCLLAFSQNGRSLPLFLSIFLFSIFWIESPVFLLLFPLLVLLSFRSLWHDGNSLSGRTLSCVLLMTAGIIGAWSILWYVALRCPLFPAVGNKLLLAAFLETNLHEAVNLLPRSSTWNWWSVVSILLVALPISIHLAFHSFHRRTVFSFVLQLTLAAVLVANIIPTLISVWKSSPNVLNLPYYSHLFLALCTGLLIACWDLMRESRKMDSLGGTSTGRIAIRQKKVLTAADIDSEEDVYEVRDNRFVCYLGSLLGFALFILTFTTPIFNFTTIYEKGSRFLHETILLATDNIGDGDWVFNAGALENSILLQCHQQGKTILPLHVDSRPRPATSPRFTNLIRTDPAFAEKRIPLLNEASISLQTFLREWITGDENAYKRLVSFRHTEELTKYGLTAVPSGFFFRFLPSSGPINYPALIQQQQEFVDRFKTALPSARVYSIPYFAQQQRVIEQQVAFVGNEFACQLVRKNYFEEAKNLLREMAAFDPENLTVLFNRYALFDRGDEAQKQSEEFKEIEEKIRTIPLRVDAFTSADENEFQHLDSLVNPDIIPLLRRRYWIQRGRFYKFMSAEDRARNEQMISSMQHKKEQLYRMISQNLDRNEYDKAENAIRILQELDEEDPEIAINMARIAVQKGDAASATSWLEAAKKQNVPHEETDWLEASLLYLNGKAEEAEKFLNDVIPNQPNNVYVWGLLCKILLDAGNLSEVNLRTLPALRNATNRKDHYLLHVTHGYLLLAGKNLIAARTAFKRALEMNQYLTDVRNQILMIDDTLDVPLFCEEDAVECLRQMPDHALANFLMGMVRYHTCKPEFAEDFFQRSFRKDGNAAAQAGLGAIQLQRKNFAEAERLLEESYRKDPNRLFTGYLYALSCIEQKKLDQAKTLLDPLLEKHPEDLMVQYTNLRYLSASRKIEAAYQLTRKLEPELNRLMPYEKQVVTAFCDGFLKMLVE